MQRPLQVGDIVEAHFIELNAVFRKDVWKPMVVESIQGGQFVGRLQRGFFDHSGCNRMAFAFVDQGNTWRS